jgi:hypothetical protein
MHIKRLIMQRNVLMLYSWVSSCSFKTENALIDVCMNRYLHARNVRHRIHATYPPLRA